jgi:DNA polymerase-1
VPLGEVTSDMRRKAKVINFGILYGMGVNALRQNLGGTRAEAQQFYEEYFATFTGLARFLEEVKKKARQTGFTETYFGRRRYFPGINSALPHIAAAEERMAINAPFQGTSADLTKLAMVGVEKLLHEESLGDDVFLLLQIHDELMFEVKKERVEKITPLITEVMESVMTEDIPIVVNAKHGKNWGEME